MSGSKSQSNELRSRVLLTSSTITSIVTGSASSSRGLVGEMLCTWTLQGGVLALAHPLLRALDVDDT